VTRFAFALAVALIAAFVGVCAPPVSGLGQDPPSSSVPELEGFHKVIQPLWHTAYPAKDGAELRKMAGAVEAGIAKIASAKLPPILHEKEAAWTRGLAELKSVGAAYARAAAGTDDGALLVAAENLHTAYEALVRVIRPVVKEMDEFHKTLYVMQHTYVPERRWDAVCGIAGELVARAEAVAGATLPKRVEGKAAAFKTAAGALVADAKALAAACRVNRPSEIEQAADRLHSRYQQLEQVFE
jgi:hypothetical protein